MIITLRTCDVCGDTNCFERMQLDPHWNVKVPVITCLDCDLSYVDERAEDIRVATIDSEQQ